MYSVSDLRIELFLCYLQLPVSDFDPKMLSDLSALTLSCEESFHLPMSYERRSDPFPYTDPSHPVHNNASVLSKLALDQSPHFFWHSFGIEHAEYRVHASSDLVPPTSRQTRDNILPHIRSNPPPNCPAGFKIRTVRHQIYLVQRCRHGSIFFLVCLRSQWISRKHIPQYIHAKRNDLVPGTLDKLRFYPNRVVNESSPVFSDVRCVLNI